MKTAQATSKETALTGISPVRKSRVSDEVTVQLTRLILSGDFAPGAKLPTERDLAPRFSVTRTSLREALRRMEHMGLLRVRQGDGIYIEDYSINSSLEFVKFLVESGIGLDPEFVKDLEETRRIFATTLVGLAADRISPESIDRLQALVDNCPEPGSPELLSGEWDFLFYREIAIGAGNRVLLYMLNSFRDFFSVTRRLYCILDTGHEESLAAINLKLVDALRQGDGELAKKIVSDRMEKDAALLQQMLDSGLDLNNATAAGGIL